MHNNRTNLMNLQFGSEKCVRMHIGKIHESSICVILHLMYRGKRSLKIKIGQIHWKQGDAECVRRNISRGCGVKRWKDSKNIRSITYRGKEKKEEEKIIHTERNITLGHLDLGERDGC